MMFSKNTWMVRRNGRNEDRRKLSPGRRKGRLPLLLLTISAPCRCRVVQSNSGVLVRSGKDRASTFSHSDGSNKTIALWLDTSNCVLTPRCRLHCRFFRSGSCNHLLKFSINIRPGAPAYAGLLLSRSAEKPFQQKRDGKAEQ